MIADENFEQEYAPEIAVDQSLIIVKILESLRAAAIHFKPYIKAHVKKTTLNEDELTQIFVEQIDIQLRKFNYSFGVKSQYRDIYHYSPGFSDFYFHPIDEGKSTSSLSSWESKRLPAPAKTREKEYVIGSNENGGIERYKIQKHGRGLAHCGMVAFIEEHQCAYWKYVINQWIKDLAGSGNGWHNDEVLTEKDLAKHYQYLTSVAHRAINDSLILHHFWLS